MSLKELISSLIEPISARPKSQFYQTITPTSGQTASYTMPVDGWVQLYGENPAGSNQSVQLWGGENQATLSTSTTVQSPATWSSSAIGFYRKGDLVFYAISGFSGMKLNIFALVWGGAKRLLSQSLLLVRGGGLCLKTFSARLLKQCLRTRRATLQRNACQTGILYIRNLLIRKVVRQRHLADGCESKHIVVGCKVVQTVFSLLLPIKTKIGHVCLYLYKKGKPSLGMLKDWSKEMLVCGLSTTRQTNSLTAKEVCHG